MSEGTIQTSGNDPAELKADERLHPKTCQFYLIVPHGTISHVSLLTCFCYQLQKSNQMHIAHSKSVSLELVPIYLISYRKLELHFVPVQHLSWTFQGTKFLNFVHQTLIIQLWWKVHHGPWPVRVFTDRYGTLKQLNCWEISESKIVQVSRPHWLSAIRFIKHS